jgi:hypothetical protein
MVWNNAFCGFSQNIFRRVVGRFLFGGQFWPLLQIRFNLKTECAIPTNGPSSFCPLLIKYHRIAMYKDQYIASG